MANTPEEGGRAYGVALAGYLRQPEAASAVTLTKRSNPLAVVRVRTEATKVIDTLPIPPERAFHVILQLCDLPSHDLWLDDQPIRTGFYPATVSACSICRVARAHESGRRMMRSSSTFPRMLSTRWQLSSERRRSMASVSGPAYPASTR